MNPSAPPALNMQNARCGAALGGIATIFNSIQKGALVMAKSTKDYAAEVRALKSERDSLQDELDEANEKLNEIDGVLYGEEEEEDDDEEGDE